MYGKESARGIGNAKNQSCAFIKRQIQNRNTYYQLYACAKPYHPGSGGHRQLLFSEA